MAGFPLGRGNLLPVFRRQLLEPDPDNPQRLRIADLRDATGVMMRMHPPGCERPLLGGAAAIVDVPGALVQYDWTVADQATYGRRAAEWHARWTVTYSDGKTKDFPNDGWDVVSVT